MVVLFDFFLSYCRRYERLSRSVALLFVVWCRERSFYIHYQHGFNRGIVSLTWEQFNLTYTQSVGRFGDVDVHTCRYAHVYDICTSYNIIHALTGIMSPRIPLNTDAGSDLIHMSRRFHGICWCSVTRCIQDGDFGCFVCIAKNNLPEFDLMCVWLKKIPWKRT